MATIKDDATLLDMAIVLEQQENLKRLIEGRTRASTIRSVIIDEEESLENKFWL